MHAPFSLPVSGRRVRRLHLRAGSEAQAQRAAIALSDALHTATLPHDRDGRVLAIRRLALGRIHAASTPVTLALSLESAIREAATRAVWFDAPGALAAEVVAFPSRIAALGTLGRKLADRADTSAWFWNHLVPGWRETVSRGDQWRRLLESAHDGEEAPLTVARVVAEAARSGPAAIEEILAAISSRASTGWLLALGFDPVSRDSAATQRPTPGGEMEATFDRCLEFLRVESTGIARVRSSPAAGAASVDPRRLWLGIARVLETQPSLAARRDLPALVAGWISRRNRAPGSDATASALREFTAPDELRRTSAPRAPRDKPTPRASNPPHSDADSENAPPRFGLGELEISSHAGLLFLVPVLKRLGLPRRLAHDDPRLGGDFGARLLVFLGRRAGMADEDPLARALLAGLCDADPTPAWMYAAWSAAVRTWCRRHGNFPVRHLVERHGRLRATRTHLDFFFEPAQADPGLRRLALDLDPGWIPWLGRVVHFHYGHPDERSG